MVNSEDTDQRKIRVGDKSDRRIYKWWQSPGIQNLMVAVMTIVITTMGARFWKTLDDIIDLAAQKTVIIDSIGKSGSILTRLDMLEKQGREHGATLNGLAEAERKREWDADRRRETPGN